MSDYVACLEDAQAEYWIGALRWSVDHGTFLPGGWLQVVLAYRDLDLALRISVRGGGRRALLLASGADACGDRVRMLLRSLQETADVPGDLEVPASADEFDAMVCDVPEIQVRYRLEGLRAQSGHTLGFRYPLFPVFMQGHTTTDMSWQINLRAWHGRPEQMKSVLERIDWWRHDSPLPANIRTVEADLLGRLRGGGWIGCEFLAFDDHADLERWQRLLQAAFESTVPQARIDLELGAEVEQCVVLGFHPWRLYPQDFATEALAASHVSHDELSAIGASFFARKERPRMSREEVDLWLYKRRARQLIADEAAESALRRFVTKLNAKNAADLEKMAGMATHLAQLGNVPVESLVFLAENPDNARLLSEIAMQQSYLAMTPEQIQTVKTGQAPRAGKPDQAIMDLLMRMHESSMSGMQHMGAMVRDKAVGVAQAGSARALSRDRQCPVCGMVGAVHDKFCAGCRFQFGA